METQSTASETITEATITPLAQFAEGSGLSSPSEYGLTRSPETRVLASVSVTDEEEGYDSDGALGPFFDQVEHEESIEDGNVEVPLGDEQGLEGGVQVDTSMDPNPIDEPIWSKEDVTSGKYKNKEMQTFLKERGIKYSKLKKTESSAGKY